MKKIKCLIVEDEPLAAKVIEDYVRMVPFLELAGICKDAICAATLLQETPVQLLFLDIHLPKIKGLAFLRTLAQPPAVIITTAYHQYAVEGFELNVTDYLLKPVEFERFLAAVNKAAAQLTTPERKYLFLPVNRKQVKVWYEDILYVESLKEYVKVVTAKGTHITRMSTQEIENILPAALFQRVHRSFIIAVARVDSYSADEVEIGGVIIPVGKMYKEVIGKL
jgi:DNA-binding LytR/AlgR family response regulator